MVKKELLERFAYIIFGAGIAWLGEHIVSKGYTTWEIFGHETYGIVLIIISFILLAKGRKKNENA